MFIYISSTGIQRDSPRVRMLPCTLAASWITKQNLPNSSQFPTASSSSARTPWVRAVLICPLNFNLPLPFTWLKPDLGILWPLLLGVMCLRLAHAADGIGGEFQSTTERAVSSQCDNGQMCWSTHPLTDICFLSSVLLLRIKLDVAFLFVLGIEGFV